MKIILKKERQCATQIMSDIKDFFKLEKNLNIENIMVDSRHPLDKAIFFCLIGLRTDGHKYIEQAINNGAIAIVHSKDIKEKKQGITYIKVDDTLKALNDFSDYYYDYPSHKMRVYGVTGTNGKTTIAYVIYDLLNRMNVKAGYIGTLGYIYEDKMNEQYHTTPDVSILHQTLSKAYQANCQAVSLEVSSQGLDLHRTDSVDFDVAIFTNLTQDHMDYHKNFENYFNAKARLFENMKKDGIACINIDDPYGSRLLDKCSCKTITYAIDREADYWASDIELYGDHSIFNLHHQDKVFKVTTNLVAKFNIYNLLGAITALAESSYDAEKIVSLLNNLSPIAGRCMHIDEGQDFKVIVDFAHTPDGFIKIFDYAKSITPKDGRILTVFGMRGSGDREKRPICGRIADEYCQEIIITCDDNHYEDINDILDEIEKGISIHKAYRFEQRDEAIEFAIKQCRKNDTLCILCKGTENFYKIKDEKIPYEGDDKIAHRVLKELSIDKH